MKKKHPNGIKFFYQLIFLLACLTTPKTYSSNYNINEQEALFYNGIEINQSPSTRKRLPNQIKPWTFIVYIAADNDLRAFAARNIKQMASIGSNNNINIVVQIDIKITGNNKITRRYFIEKNRIIHINANDPHSQRMDSGSPNTLISCCKWAMHDYPAQDYALILWNHGTGIIDPIYGRIINPVNLFSFNPIINKLELDRTIGFIDRIDTNQKEQRGICWDDSTGNYLTNKELELALATIRKKVLNDKKISIIGFDACLMSMLEVGNITKNYADIMVSSQEVELGTGWDYSRVLAPFMKGSFDKFTFAKHIVNTYAQTYGNITNDYTQSAIDLSHINKLEKNVHYIAQLLSECLANQKNNMVKKAIWSSHSKAFCTHFDEPSYIDMYHLYSNLEKNINQFQLNNSNKEFALKSSLKKELNIGKRIMAELIIESRVGKNLHRASGLSIYFPERKIHASYPKTKFAAHNAWVNFLTQYLLTM